MLKENRKIKSQLCTPTQIIKHTEPLTKLINKCKYINITNINKTKNKCKNSYLPGIYNDLF